MILEISSLLALVVLVSVFIYEWIDDYYLLGFLEYIEETLNEKKINSFFTNMLILLFSFISIPYFIYSYKKNFEL